MTRTCRNISSWCRLPPRTGIPICSMLHCHSLLPTTDARIPGVCAWYPTARPRGRPHAVRRYYSLRVSPVLQLPEKPTPHAKIRTGRAAHHELARQRGKNTYTAQWENGFMQMGNSAPYRYRCQPKRITYLLRASD